MNRILESLVSAIIGGGGLSAIILWLSSRKKNATDIGMSNIDTALRLKNEAVSEWKNSEEKLKEARRLLDEVQADNDIKRAYIEILMRFLDDNDVDYPSYDEFKHKRGIKILSEEK